MDEHEDGPFVNRSAVRYYLREDGDGPGIEAEGSLTVVVLEGRRRRLDPRTRNRYR